jgi:tetratricopeptide (TPR) repeat protein
MRLIKKGIALGNQGKYNEAIKCFNEAIRLDPKEVDAWNNKGVALVIQEKYDEAIKAFDEAIRLDPNLPEPGTTKVLHSKLSEGLMKQALPSPL